MDLTVRSETLSSGDQSWLASAHGTNAGRTITLDKSAFTANTHYPDGFFKSGLALTRITATGKYGPYTNAGAGTGDVLAGFLLDSPSVPADDVDPQGVLLDHGIILESRLPTPWKQTNDAVETDGKADVAGRIIFR